MIIDFDYLFLNIILLATYVIAGYNISRKGAFWASAWPCIVAFTFIMGSRYMRGNDYDHYCEVFANDEESTQHLFTFFNQFLRWIGVGRHYFYYFYSFIFAFCSMFFLKRFRRFSLCMFPLFLIAYIHFDEFMIRQALSYSFVFLYLIELFSIKLDDHPNKNRIILPKGKRYYGGLKGIDDPYSKRLRLKKKPNAIRKYFSLLFASENLLHIFYCAFLASIVISIHVANVMVLVLVTILYLFVKYPIPYYISIPILIVATYMFNVLFDFSYLNPILDMLSGQDEKMDNYIENSDVWLDEEGMQDKYTRNPIVLVFEMLGSGILFYYGYNIIKNVRKNDRISCMFFNVYVFGTIFINAFRNLEILNRIGYVFQLFWFYPVCLILFYFPKMHFSILKKYSLCFLFFFLYSYLKYLFFKEDGMTLFLWDSPYW